MKNTFLVMKNFLVIFILISFTAQGQKENDTIHTSLDKAILLESQQFLQYKTAYKAYALQRKNRHSFVLHLAKGDLTKKEITELVDNYHYILSELNDNKNEKALALKNKFPNLSDYVSQEELMIVLNEHLGFATYDK